MTVMDDIRSRLTEKYPGLAFERSRNALTVKAPVPNGFDVWVADQGEIVVGYGGWHEHFGDRVEEARRCFALGLSDQVRLKVSLRGSFEYQWTMEFLDGGDWVEDSTTGTFPLPFWRPRRIEYRQNGIIRRGGSSEIVCPNDVDARRT